MNTKKLIIASNNKGKIHEIRQMLPNIELSSLKDIGFIHDIPEPYLTFAENAAAKAKTVQAYAAKNTFADDSGICVSALNEAPGVHSARYAGTNAKDGDNLQKLLTNMLGITDRRAHYKAVICLIWDEQEHYFEGTCHGTLAEKPAGDGGFGYDPIFIPEGYSQTFGQLPQDVKNKLSHRGEAVRKMVDWIKTNANW